MQSMYEPLTFTYLAAFLNAQFVSILCSLSEYLRAANKGVTLIDHNIGGKCINTIICRECLKVDKDIKYSVWMCVVCVCAYACECARLYVCVCVCV